MSQSQEINLEGLSGAGINQYLTFQLANERYGIDILRVRTIQCLDKVTPLPDTPDFLLGVINLRGEIVPVIDLRMRFGIAEVANNHNTVVIIVRIEGEQERTIGMVADAVCDVSDVAASEVRPAPEVGDVSSVYLNGLVEIGDNMVILLDLDRLISDAILENLHAEKSAKKN